MKTLADLKRTLKVGMKIKTIRPLEDYTLPSGNIVLKETIRTITKVQTNGFSMDNCWLDFPSKACVEFLSDKAFNVYYAKKVGMDFDRNQRGELLATYIILD